MKSQARWLRKMVFADITQTGKEPDVIIKEKGLAQIIDEAVIASMVDKALSDNPDNAAKYKSGKTTLFGFFVGQVMKATRGQANPGVVNKLLKQKLNG